MKFNQNKLNMTYSRSVNKNMLNFDNLKAPAPIQYLFNPRDIVEINKIANAVSLTGKNKLKFQMIIDIMMRNNFEKLGTGTNRLVFQHTHFNNICLKSAFSTSGIQDSPKEYVNQQFLKPYVTKCFDVSQCGTLGVFEKVLAVKTREEFLRIADDVYELLNNKIIGKYIVSDIGTNYFMNYGIREGFGPVLLDYPNVFEIDENKLYCDYIMDNGMQCYGEIDFDTGMNELYCKRCGKKFSAKDISKKFTIPTMQVGSNKYIGGNKEMIIELKKGNEVILSKDLTKETRYMKPTDKLRKEKPKGDHVIANGMYIKKGESYYQACRRDAKERQEAKFKDRTVTHQQAVKERTVIVASPKYIPDGTMIISESKAKEIMETNNQPIENPVYVEPTNPIKLKATGMDGSTVKDVVVSYASEEEIDKYIENKIESAKESKISDFDKSSIYDNDSKKVYEINENTSPYISLSPEEVDEYIENAINKYTSQLPPITDIQGDLGEFDGDPLEVTNISADKIYENLINLEGAIEELFITRSASNIDINSTAQVLKDSKYLFDGDIIKQERYNCSPKEALEKEIFNQIFVDDDKFCMLIKEEDGTVILLENIKFKAVDTDDDESEVWFPIGSKFLDDPEVELRAGNLINSYKEFLEKQEKESKEELIPEVPTPHPYINKNYHNKFKAYNKYRRR